MNEVKLRIVLICGKQRPTAPARETSAQIFLTIALLGGYGFNVCL